MGLASADVRLSSLRKYFTAHDNTMKRAFSQSRPLKASSVGHWGPLVLSILDETVLGHQDV